MLRVDLDRAGIQYKTDDGYFDFHATRHGAITVGSEHMSIFNLKEFARHSKIETTMRYTHARKAELREAVNRLPDVSHGARSGRNRRISPVQPDQKSDQSVIASRDLMSSVARRRAAARNDASSDDVRACRTDVTGCPQRARRDSNPQPPDRQSGTLTN